MSFLNIFMSFIMSFFLMLKHPLSLVLLLIMLTLTSMLCFLLYMNLSWLSMILFLVFLGGLLVIFTYLSALVPNELYFFNPLWLTLIMSPMLSNYFNMMSALNQSQTHFINETMNTSSTSTVLLFLIFLLITLLTAMTMSNQLKTPLHQSTY